MTASSVAVELRVGIQELDELPPLPQNLQSLLDAATDAEIDIGVFAKLIEQDPSITARIMGIANSAYFAPRKPVRSVADAVIRVLGLALTKSVVVSIAVSGGFDPRRCPRFDTERYWLKALLTAGLARQLARSLELENKPPPDAAYLCGLLHEIGLLALTHISPRAMNEVFRAANEHPEKPFARVVADIIGFNHCKAGAIVAARWQLPEDVEVALEHQLHSEYSGQHWPQSTLVGVCARWAEQQLSQVDTPEWNLDALSKLGVATDTMDDIVAQSRAHMGEVSELAKVFCRTH